MLLVKTANGQVEQFPYTLGDLRRDNPQTSFPKRVPEETLAPYGVEVVQPTKAPAIDSKTHKLIQGVENAGGTWQQTWSTSQLPQDQAEGNVRRERDRFLADTDWMALSDNTLSPAWATYRQALRDITDQEGFPYAVQWPEKPE